MPHSAGESGTIRVRFAPHLRTMTEAVAFEGAGDSGRENGPTIYEGKGAVFSGGRRITGWKQDGAVWVAKEVSAFEQLWVNGRRAIRARTPNATESAAGAINSACFSAKSQVGSETFPA